MWKACEFYRNRSSHVKLNQVGVEVTTLCLWFSLVAVKNILSKLSFLYARKIFPECQTGALCRIWRASFPYSSRFSSSPLPPTDLFVPMFLKPISLCNFPKLLGNLLSFSRFPFLISIYTLNSSTSFFTHGMSLFLMLDYFLHSLIQSDLFHS